MEERVGGICDGAIPYKDFIHYDSFPFQSLMISSRQSSNTLGASYEGNGDKLQHDGREGGGN